MPDTSRCQTQHLVQFGNLEVSSLVCFITQNFSLYVPGKIASQNDVFLYKLL